MTRAPLTYCSFASPTACLGVVVLDGAMCTEHAAQALKARGWHLGGDLLTVIVPDDLPEHNYFALIENRNKVLSGPEARELFAAKSIREHQEEDPEWQPGGRASP